ncbi:MAG: hypothetical protein RL263_381 [Bacteroidota bacterium]
MNAQIITIGDELLLGQTIDTNSVYLAQFLNPLGIQISKKTAISDRKEDIINTLNLALSEVEVIIITGGLGPTKDDITKKTLADYFKTGFRIDQNVLEHLENIFKSRGRELLETNKLQAEVPEICEVLFNQEGTAPGMLFRSTFNGNKRWIFSLPGVPNEVKYICEYSMKPILLSEIKGTVLRNRTLLTLMQPESLLSRDLEDFEQQLPQHLKLAYLPSFNLVKLRLTEQASGLESTFNEYWIQLKEILGDRVYAEGDVSVVLPIVEFARQNGLKIATAESCTGGFIGNQIVKMPGISDVFEGSVISYSNSIKTQILGVNPNVLEEKGAVSEEVAKEMVVGVCENFNCQIGISTSGIAGPTGGTPEKPVGLVYIGIKYLDQVIVKKQHIRGNREQFMERVHNVACFYLMQLIRESF